MGVSKSYLLLFLSVWIGFAPKAQDTLKFSRNQYEELFLRQNLLVLAERMNVTQAEARVIQAKLWPNPTAGLDDVNLWATQKQLDVFGEELRGFGGGKFGKNRQFSASLEQMIQTAGKRRKNIALEQTNVQRSEQAFEELLRNLKIEFRHLLTQLQYLQQMQTLYENQFRSVRQLTTATKKLVDQDFAPRGEWIRLRALELELANTIQDQKKELLETQRDLKIMTHLPASTHLIITHEGFDRNQQDDQLPALDKLMEEAKKARPDLRLADLEKTYAGRLYEFEKAQKVPNLTLKAGYDRGSNFMFNFVGFGVAMDIPLFNKNQGNIKSARIGMEQASLLRDFKEHSATNEVVLAYKNLVNARAHFNGIEAGYEASLDELQSRYTKNFSTRNIGLIEYIDFLEAYLSNKKIILDAMMDVNKKSEDLNHAVGKDLIR